MWRGALLVASLLYGAALLKAEIDHTEGYSSTGDFWVKRQALFDAAHQFPFDDRFWKGPIYLDFLGVGSIDPKIALADIEWALHSDPYAPDLLNAKVFFGLHAGDLAAAQEALTRFMNTEGGAVPTFLRRLPSP